MVAQHLADYYPNDSEDVTDALRAENARLRGRVRELEELIEGMLGRDTSATDRLLLLEAILKTMPVAYCKLDGDGKALFIHVGDPALFTDEVRAIHAEVFEE